MAAKRKKTQARSAVKRSGNVPAKFCFVLMPFREPFDSYYKMVYVPAIKAAGLDPKRADEIFKAGPVTKDIWEHVVGSKILVAELTGRNPNVFYELGLAHAVGRPVVLVTQDLEDVPFDLQHLRILQYNTVNADWSSKLQGDLTKAITETMRDPMAALAFPPVEQAEGATPKVKRPTAKKRPTSPRAADGTPSADLSSQYALKLFGALPAEGKIRLMELALTGRELTQAEILEVFLEAMGGEGKEA